MCNRHSRLLENFVEATRACYPMVRVGVLCAIGFASALFAGCGELEPMREPEVVDLELTTDTLKASVRDAQRTVVELRADLDARRMELAEAQVARAQLEGRVREAERRVIEARQVIELQREELAAARTERERVSRSSLQLQGQMKRLQKRLSKAGISSSAHNGQETAPQLSSGAMHKGQKAMPVSAQRNQPSEFPEPSQMAVTSAAERPMPANREPKYVSVKPGDTLWRIAQRYRVDVEDLRTLNQLIDNNIVIGQALWLPDDRTMSRVGAVKGESMP
jgi:LysM repeat protein